MDYELRHFLETLAIEGTPDATGHVTYNWDNRTATFTLECGILEMARICVQAWNLLNTGKLGR